MELTATSNVLAAAAIGAGGVVLGTMVGGFITYMVERMREKREQDRAKRCQHEISFVGKWVPAGDITRKRMSKKSKRKNRSNPLAERLGVDWAVITSSPDVPERSRWFGLKGAVITILNSDACFLIARQQMRHG
jgi:membrane protein YqaA with SNARE-associated domain